MADNGEAQEPGRGSPNPFGHVDHTPFAGLGAELVFGRRDDGSIVHVSEVVSGLACRCLCPACDGRLVARKGPLKEHHFGHYGKGTGCGRGAETNAHIWAKQVLERELKICLPAVKAGSGKDAVLKHRGGMFEFARAELEKILDDIVPDVILTTKGGQRLLVEVMVTHACGPEKIEKLRAMELPTIEVDLGAWRTSSDRPQIEAALIESAPREWLFNRKLDEAEEELHAKLARRKAKVDAEHARSVALKQALLAAELRLAAAELERRVNDLVDAAAEAAASRSEAAQDEHDRALREERDDLLQRQLPCCGFLVPPPVWQAALFYRVVNKPASMAIGQPNFSIDDIAGELQDCIHPAFQQRLPDPVVTALKSRLPGKLTPHGAIDHYVHSLAGGGYLRFDGFGGFTYTKEHAAWLDREYQRIRLEAERRRTVNRSVATILEAIPEEEQADFAVEVWQTQPWPGRTESLDAIIAGPDDAWLQLKSALRAIEKMTGDGPLAEDWLGLPLAGVAARARQRLEQQLSDERNQRLDALRVRALSILVSDAAAWLEAPIKEGDTPLALAARDADGLERALQALGIADADRRKRVAAEACTARCRAALVSAAEKELGTETAGFFLKNHDQFLGGAPSAYCVDDVTLRAALRALDPWIARRKRAR